MPSCFPEGLYGLHPHQQCVRRQWLCISGSQHRPVLSPKGHLTLSGDIFGCYHFFQGRVLLAFITWVQTKDADKHPTMHKIAPSSLSKKRIIQLKISVVPRLRYHVLLSLLILSGF